MTARPIRISINALGGQGGGVLADWIVSLAEAEGWIAQATSVPGVAQRTGATVYYLELAPPDPEGREPVMALMPVPGDVDVVIASELMEAGRAIARGLVTPDRTTLIASTHRIYAIAEKSALGDGRIGGAGVLNAAAALGEAPDPRRLPGPGRRQRQRDQRDPVRARWPPAAPCPSRARPMSSRSSWAASAWRRSLKAFDAAWRRVADRETRRAGRRRPAADHPRAPPAHRRPARAGARPGRDRRRPRARLPGPRLRRPLPRPAGEGRRGRRAPSAASATAGR